MRRIGLRTGRTPLFLAMLAVALVIFLPLRLVLGWVGIGGQGMTALSARGSVWSGSLTEARFGDVALGDLAAGLSPLPLLLGRARIVIAGRAVPAAGGPAAGRIVGAVEIARHRLGIDDVSGTIPVGRAFAPLPITGVDLTDVSVRFRDGNCESAEGRVLASLSGTLGGVPLAESLSGNARCDSGALLLPLTGQAGADGANLRLWQDGRYRAELTLAPSDPAAATALQATGFVQTQSGWQLSIEGRF